MTEEIVRWFVEHSPPDSGPAYLWLSVNWDIMEILLTTLLAFIAAAAIGFAAATYLEISE